MIVSNVVTCMYVCVCVLSFLYDCFKGLKLSNVNWKIKIKSLKAQIQISPCPTHPKELLNLHFPS